MSMLKQQGVAVDVVVYQFSARHPGSAGSAELVANAGAPPTPGTPVTLLHHGYEYEVECLAICSTNGGFKISARLTDIASA